MREVKQRVGWECLTLDFVKYWFRQARSQKFAMGGLFGGSVGEAPSCRRLGVWEQSPQPPEARGCGGGAPSARKFCIFLQNQLNFRAILIKNNAFKTWHRNYQPSMIELVALMGYMGSG